MMVIVDNEVGVMLGRFDKLLISGCNVVFPAIKHILKVITPLIVISDYPSPDFDMLFGINKNLEVEHLRNIWIMKTKIPSTTIIGAGLKTKSFGLMVELLKVYSILCTSLPALRSLICFAKAQNQ